MNLRGSFLVGAVALLALPAIASAAEPAKPAAAKPAAKPVLPFIEDDYPKALARARERDLPLFVEAWAPW